MIDFTLVLLVLALAQWLAFWWRMSFRRGDGRDAETSFLVSTLVLALVWVYADPSWRVRRSNVADLPERKRGCALLREGMAEPAILAAMGTPARRVSEAETRGPNAEAWVYDDARCVAHLLDHRIRAVDHE
jgi:hypothetical protein